MNDSRNAVVPIPRVEETVRLELMEMAESPYPWLQISSTFPCWIVSHVLEGAVTTSTMEETFAVSPGDVMVHPPNVPFVETAAGPGTHQWMMFDAQNGYGFDLMSLQPLAYVVPLADSGKYSRLFRQLLQFWNEPNLPLRDFGCFHLANQLIFEVIQSWQASGLPALDRAGSPSERVARGVYRKTPKQMLREFRLNRAKSLLRSTALPLGEIAARTGLGDASYMSRTFVKHFGETPGAFRAKAVSVRSPYLDAGAPHPPQQ